MTITPHSVLSPQSSVLRLLYVASAIEVDGQSGGATHVEEVAAGLTTLGHRVRVIARARNPAVARAHMLSAHKIRLTVTRYHPMLALLGYPQVRREVRRFKPDVVIERFYNFAGAGVLAARRAGIPTMLEVNAPIVDPPGSLKSRVDRALLGVMRRWALRQARWSRAIVTPLATTIPPTIPRSKIHELPWGANVERFTPVGAEERAALRDHLRRDFGLTTDGPLAVFLGSFRSWHGVGHFAEAARALLDKGQPLAFLAIGGGPELAPLRETLRGWGVPPERFALTGAQPHERIPSLLGAADIGVAPFDIAAHAPLREFGFYWSPLKVFEYMATGLPVVTVDITPLNTIARHDHEGLLYASGDIAALTACMARLANDIGLRERLGTAGRERVVAHYSWQAHCAALDKIVRRLAHGQ